MHGLLVSLAEVRSISTEYSFDIVAEIDLAEVQNAQNNALKQIQTRYDFKGKLAQLEFDKTNKLIVMEGSNDYIVGQISTIFMQQLAKRNVDLKALQLKDTVPAAKGGIRTTYDIRDSLTSEQCKQITQAVKDNKMKKVKVAIMGESVRVTSPSRDELQAVQALVRTLPLECPLKFTNYREGK